MNPNDRRWKNRRRARVAPRLSIPRLSSVVAWAAVLCLGLAACELSQGRKPPPPAQDRSGPRPSPGDLSRQAPIPPAQPAPPIPPVLAPQQQEQGRIILTPPLGLAGKTPVGLLLPLSGPNAAIGRSLLDAAQLALFEVANEDFVLLPRDTAGTPEGARAAATDALQSGAQLLLGPVFAASAIEVTPLAQAAGVNMIAFTNNRAAASEGAFVIGFLPGQRVARVVAFAAARGAARFAALIPEGPYGEQVAAGFEDAVRRAGMFLIRVERYGPGREAATEAVKRLASYDARRAMLLSQREALEGKRDEVSRQTLRRLESRETMGDVEFDAVLLPETGAALTAIAPLLPYYDIDTRKVRILGINDWSDRALRREPALKGAWYAGPSTEARTAFAERFSRVYGRQAHTLAPLAYDATALAAVLGAREGGADFSMEALTAPNGFAGSAGLFRFRRNGQVEHRFAVFEVQPEGVSVVGPAPEAFDAVTN